MDAFVNSPKIYTTITKSIELRTFNQLLSYNFHQFSLNTINFRTQDLTKNTIRIAYVTSLLFQLKVMQL